MKGHFHICMVVGKTCVLCARTKNRSSVALGIFLGRQVNFAARGSIGESFPYLKSW